MNDQQPAGNRPAHSERIGNIEVDIWRNANEIGTGGNPFYTASPLKHYKDAAGEWKTSELQP